MVLFSFLYIIVINLINKKSNLKFFVAFNTEISNLTCYCSKVTLKFLLTFKTLFPFIINKNLISKLLN